MVPHMDDSDVPTEPAETASNPASRGREVQTDTLERPPAQTEEGCAVEATLAVIGGKWKPILLFHLLTGPHRYSTLQRMVPRATDRMLTRSLRELQQDRLVSRSVYAEVPVRVEYALTAKGRSLVPILQAMSDWGSGKS